MHPIDRLKNAKIAADEGRFDDALREYLWFHDHALEEEPALYGVRLSFALAWWAELGAIHPPARRALEEIRDRKTAALERGDGDRRLFSDASSINYYLNDESATHRLFAGLDATYPALAAQCSDIALQAVVARKDYLLAQRYLGDPSAALMTYSRRLNEDVADLEEEGATESPQLDAYVHIYAERARLLVDVLRGVGDDETAARIRASAVELVQSPSVRDRVRSALDSAD